MPKSSGLNSHDHSHPPALHSAPGAAVLDRNPDQNLDSHLGEHQDGHPAASDAPVRRKRPRAGQTSVPPATFHAHPHDDHHGSNHQAELFYLQKQIQQQTQMIFVLEDGGRIQGVIEWYDRHSIKVRGKSRVLIYKSAIKYLYKAGELGSAPGE